MIHITGRTILKVSRVTARVAAILIVFWIGGATAHSITTLVSPAIDSPPPPTQIPDPRTTLIPAEGYWSFGDTHYAVATSTMTPDELSARFQKVTAAQELSKRVRPVSESHSPDTRGGFKTMVQECEGRLSLLENALRPIADTQTEASSIDPSCCCIDAATLKACLQVDERQELTSLLFAQPESGDSWRLLEFSVAGDRHTPTEHLLPIGQQAQRVCGRWSNDGRLLMELVRLNVDQRQLLDSWAAAGWQMQHTEWGNRETFSYLCAKDSVVVYAWSANMNQITSLMLSMSRDTSASETLPAIGINQ